MEAGVGRGRYVVYDWGGGGVCFVDVMLLALKMEEAMHSSVQAASESSERPGSGLWMECSLADTF